MDATDAADATCKDVAALPSGPDSWGRSDSLQAVLRWHEQGQKRLSIGLELECYLPDLGVGYGPAIFFENRGFGEDLMDKGGGSTTNQRSSLGVSHMFNHTRHNKWRPYRPSR